MKNLEPKIYRQRLVIEGKYTAEVSPEFLTTFLKELSKTVEMTIIFGPSVINLAQTVDPIHEGYEAVLIWAESGAQLYTWHKFKFFTLDMYTCVAFDVNKVVEFTKQQFKTTDIVYQEIT